MSFVLICSSLDILSASISSSSVVFRFLLFLGCLHFSSFYSLVIKFFICLLLLFSCFDSFFIVFFSVLNNSSWILLFFICYSSIFSVLIVCHCIISVLISLPLDFPSFDSLVSEFFSVLTSFSQTN